MMFTLDREIPADLLAGIDADLHVQFAAGTRVQDVIRSQTGIGYGGHFAETSPDEEAIYSAIARSPREFEWICQIREIHAHNLRCLIEGETPWLI